MNTPKPAEQLLAVLDDMLRELRGHAGPAPRLDDDLERQLGIDSLARMELMLRLERAFDLRLPEAMVQSAMTPRDLLRSLQAAAPRLAPVIEAVPISTAPAAGLVLPHQAATLGEVLHWHAERAPEHAHIRLLDDSTATTLTHGELWRRAQAVAAGLQRRGVAAGDRIALMLPTGLDFFAAFSGIVIAGAVPIPVYPPFRASQLEEHLRRLSRILDNGQALLLISDNAALTAAHWLRLAADSLRGVVTVAQLTEPAAGAAPAARTAQDLAMLQYTSGSTGAPKGVLLTHANLLANIRAMGQALAVGPGDVFVSWLPLYHDMGLIGAWMGSLYHGVPLVLMPPQAFLARPSRWLRAISQYRGTLSAAPNFAYDILAAKVPDDELQGLDLSCWREALNGAEPVRAATLEAFAKRFARWGLDRRALLPVYGLAECAVGLAFPPLARVPRVDCIDRLRLHDAGVAEPVAAGDARAMQVVSCGRPLPGHEIRVVDAFGAEVLERVEGRVQFRGPSATSGYMRNPESTQRLFAGEWLETGDVGYLVDGEIHLTSRAKDLIIRGGHNIHPYDLEEAVGALPGVRRGCVAVFGAVDPASSTERVVVVAETRLRDAAEREALRARVADLAIAQLGAPADQIVLAEPHVILKTSSGKIRRAACRELYERGLLQGRQRRLGVQVARLALVALWQRLRDPLRPLAGAAYAAWAWALFGVGALLALAVASLPQEPWRKRVGRLMARFIVTAAALPVRWPDLSRWPAGAAVVAANHASYIDWLVLTAALPATVQFVAKRELSRHALLRWGLGRYGVRFVTRGDAHDSVEDAKPLLADALVGRTLAFFPEGGLVRLPGLRSFHMGAFVTAAQSGLPLVPVSLNGTRSVLRDGSWWPRRHPVSIEIHAPIVPQGSDWSHAVQLRDAAYRAIGQACGEACGL